MWSSGGSLALQPSSSLRQPLPSATGASSTRWVQPPGASSSRSPSPPPPPLSGEGCCGDRSSPFSCPAVAAAGVAAVDDRLAEAQTAQHRSLSPVPRSVVHPHTVCTLTPEVGKVLERRPYKLIAFDFDNTISTVMLGAVCDEFPKPIGHASVSEFGGLSRVQLLHQMFTTLRRHSVHFFIASRGYQKRIQVALRNVGLLPFFPDGSVICADTPEFRRHHWRKGRVVQARMGALGIPPHAALLVDDTREVLEDARGVCALFCPQTPAAGLSVEEIQSIIDGYAAATGSSTTSSATAAAAAMTSWSPWAALPSQPALVCARAGAGACGSLSVPAPLAAAADLGTATTPQASPRPPAHSASGGRTARTQSLGVAAAAAAGEAAAAAALQRWEGADSPSLVRAQSTPAALSKMSFQPVAWTAQGSATPRGRPGSHSAAAAPAACQSRAP